VASVAAADVWAGGDVRETGRERPLALQWDGTRWTPVPVPEDAALDNRLNAVAAVAADDVWAAGQVGSEAAGYGPLLVHWDGSAWTAAPLPKQQSILTAVAALAPDQVWAAGFGGAPSNVVLLHWDGAHWGTDFVGDVGGNAQVGGLSARAANDVWAVGATEVQAAQQPLTLHWDGTAWQDVPRPAVQRGQLTAVAAVAPDDVWAVGGAGQGHSLILHWDGRAWTVVPHPTPLNYRATPVFQALAVQGAQDIWAVGGAEGTEAGPQPLTFHWDGQRWQARSTPPQPPATLTGRLPIATMPNWLYGVTLSGPQAGWAVGYNQILRYEARTGAACGTPLPATPPLVAPP
jgi:hypothetical protein